MSDATRDLTIRLSVVMADGKIAPPDLSEFRAAIDRELGGIGGLQVRQIPIGIEPASLQRAAEDFRAAMSSAASNVSVPATGGGAGGGTGGSRLEMYEREIAELQRPVDVSRIQRAVEDVQERLADAMRRTVDIGMQGYAQSVRDRAHTAAGITLDAMGVPHGEERDQIHERTARQNMAVIREHDREEVATQNRDQREADRAYNERIRDAQAGIRSWSKSKGEADSEWAGRVREGEQGLAEYSRNKRKAQADEDRKQAEIYREAEEGIRSWSKAKKEAIAAEREHEREIQQANQATIQFAKGIGQMVMATGHANQDMVRGVVAIEGFSNAAQAAVGTFGAAGIAISGIAAAMGVANYSIDRQRQINNSMHGLDVGSARDSLLGYRLGVGLQQQRSLGMANRRPNLMESRSAYQSMFTRSAEYEDIQRIDSDANLSPEQRERRRSAVGQQYDADEQMMSSRMRSEQMRKQLDDLRSNPINQAAAEAEIDQRHNSVSGRLKKQKNDLDKEVESYRGRNLFSGGISGAFNNIAGRLGNQDWAAASASRDIGVQIGQVEEDRLRDKKQLQDQVNAAKEKELQLSQGLTREAAEEYKILLGRQSQTHANVRREEEGIRQSNINFGMASAGDQALAINLEKKARKIEAQRAARDRGENVTVDTYNDHDKMIARQFGGMALKTVNLQAEEEAKKRGFQGFQFNDQTLAAAQADKLKADNDMASRGPGLKEAAEKFKEQSSDVADQIVGGLTRAFDIQGIADQIMLRIRELERSVQNWKNINGMGPK